ASADAVPQGLDRGERDGLRHHRRRPVGLLRPDQCRLPDDMTMPRDDNRPRASRTIKLVLMDIAGTALLYSCTPGMMGGRMGFWSWLWLMGTHFYALYVT